MATNMVLCTCHLKPIHKVSSGNSWRITCRCGAIQSLLTSFSILSVTNGQYLYVSDYMFRCES